ncbi:nucleoside deaminase [Pirellulales bacterium]|nr:nucleoside deaminase [Pirellulales bacterium]
MNIDELDAVEEHKRFMRRCIELAKIANSQKNTPVGSLIVINGEIVGEGIESLPTGNDVTGHAEVLACQMAVDKTGNKLFDEASLYSTAEPCFMCSYVIRQCGISLVIYGIETPSVGGITSSHAILTDASMPNWKPAPQVLGGILRDECQQLRSTNIK